MKKHTLFGMGLLFLSHFSQAQVADSTLKNVAIRKVLIFADLLKYLAGPELDLTTKAEIERKLEADFVDNEEVRFYQDLNFQFGNAQQIAVPQYFSQLKVLYPNGASLKTEDFEFSEIFYNQARDMYYIQARCFRDFKGLNVLAKKEVRVVKNLEYQVKLMEAGRLDIEIVSGRLAEGDLQTPQGLDKTLVEIKKTNLAAKLSIGNEEKKIANAEHLLESVRSKVIRYETLAEVQKKK